MHVFPAHLLPGRSATPPSDGRVEGRPSRRCCWSDGSQRETRNTTYSRLCKFISTSCELFAGRHGSGCEFSIIYIGRCSHSSRARAQARVKTRILRQSCVAAAAAAATAAAAARVTLTLHPLPLNPQDQAWKLYKAKNRLIYHISSGRSVNIEQNSKSKQFSFPLC